MALRTTIRTVNDVIVIELAGRITGGDSRLALRNTVRQYIGEGYRDFVLNIGDVRYVDSSGLGELVSIYTSLDAVGGRLGLVGITRKVRDLLVISKLLVVFDCFESTADAIRSLERMKKDEENAAEAHSVGVF